ncbi:sigma-70 family RNA polymerase sigma factor [Desulfofundulus thermobenzoicus]|uniref:Sigma-70 family RNA polymerase sigma factor n=1 Tax=Desulfofundulus thermobenzoicus TaxID=29376 RepID=A0A6N7IU17_9FIRM|nr:sigma-70 family RNA polymerase sigma factor [Desulfofundulus thermobenzoicus]MQL53009.1 sigma-70 family RNA polymerase sigma factor [Desulfofundulus thermobenzoicus]HHW42850.1 sigma-70 family RNA polymerase sigma factor [Desulfotomaculum sp.]
MHKRDGNEPGARASFAELYDRHFDAVNRYLRYRMDNPWDADDLTAAVFLKALENFPKYRGEAPFAVWLFRIAHNAYVDYLRGRRERVFTEEEMSHLGAAPSGPEEEFLRSEEVRQLKDMLRRLPPEQRDVVSLRYAGELKFSQIALVLGKSTAAVRMIHHRALQALRNAYLKEGEEVEGIGRQ